MGMVHLSMKNSRKYSTLWTQKLFFFETAKILLTSHEVDCKLLSVPYILVINKTDGSIGADKNN